MKHIVFNKKLSVFYFSVLADRILHSTWALSLFPFGLARWKSPYLLLLTRSSTRCSCCVTHYVIVMQTSSLSDHICKATSIGKHLVLIRAPDKIVGDQTLLFVAGLLISSVWSTVTSISLILSLTLDINWRLRSYSILSRCRTWFLGVTSLFRNHLPIESMSLICSHVATK